MVFPLERLEDYQLSFKPEHTIFRETVREFVKREVEPIALKIDETDEVPKELLRKMAEAGFFGIGYPEDLGGQGGDVTMKVIAIEEISRVCAALTVIMGTNDLFSIPLMLFGTDEQKKKYIPPIARGEKFGAHAMTEPQAGSDVAGIQTRAVRKGDRWLINGRKIFISNADLADYMIVFARTGEPLGKKLGRWLGITPFIVDKNTPGLRLGSKLEKRGLRGSHIYEVVLDNVEVPDENRVGEIGYGFLVAMQTYDVARIGVAAQALGMAQAAFEAAFQYTLQRVAFDKPIAHFQGVQFTIVEMASKLMSARYLVYLAAQMASQMRPEFTYLASLAKMYATEVAEEIISKSINLHGGVGVIHETGLEKLLRDVKITQIYEGASNIQRLVTYRQLIRILMERGVINPELGKELVLSI